MRAYVAQPPSVGWALVSRHSFIGGFARPRGLKPAARVGAQTQRGVAVLRSAQRGPLCYMGGAVLAGIVIVGC